MDKRRDKNDENESQSLSEPQESQVIINMPPGDENAHVVYLPDANLGATETETSVEDLESKRVSFDQDDEPCTSGQTAEKSRKSKEEVSTLSTENLESNTESPTPRQLHNVLLYCFSRNVDTLESSPAVILQIPQYSELGTQTAEVISQPRRLRLNLTNLRTDRNGAPCERSHHTITIRGNNLPPNPPQLRQTICARIGRSIGDFVAAFCLCLQVNKDCVFCLGFFVAFVISCSFLTAFFYRTLSFSSSPVRVAAHPPHRRRSDYET
ncbi:uncharacterized protein [Drosophila takahashii]|uniref:uncharacterized protein isoform X2 n=1 Tax=Drosophila takahashii TaxID=29030 RepID=UPI00389940C1